MNIEFNYSKTYGAAGIEQLNKSGYKQIWAH